MNENYRDTWGHRHQDDERRNQDPAQRWRRGEDRYRREAYGSGYGAAENRFDDDRYEREHMRDFGYGRAYRDDDYGGRGSYGRGDERRDRRGYALRDYYGARDYEGREQGQHWHEQNYEQRAGHPYTGTYGGTGDSSYFTGNQGSWAVSSGYNPQRAQGYGGQSYGEDYRAHGYDERDERRGFWDRASDEVASWFGDDDAARRREEDHRGRGPKDYVRSDERIREDANDRLTDDWRVDATNVTVSVQNGEITLNGTVHSREAKRRAEDVVDNISGVRHVQNNLRVEETGQQSGNWALNRTSTAEGGTLSQTEAAKTSKT